jgi:hypothetical protein
VEESLPTRRRKTRQVDSNAKDEEDEGKEVGDAGDDDESRDRRHLHRWWNDREYVGYGMDES